MTRPIGEVLQRSGHTAPDGGPPRGPTDPGRYRSVLVIEQYADSLDQARERIRAFVRAAQRVGIRVVEQGETARAEGPWKPENDGPGPA